MDLWNAHHEAKFSGYNWNIYLDLAEHIITPQTAFLFPLQDGYFRQYEMYTKSQSLNECEYPFPQTPLIVIVRAHQRLSESPAISRKLEETGSTILPTQISRNQTSLYLDKTRLMMFTLRKGAIMRQVNQYQKHRGHRQQTYVPSSSVQSLWYQTIGQCSQEKIGALLSRLACSLVAWKAWVMAAQKLWYIRCYRRHDGVDNRRGLGLKKLLAILLLLHEVEVVKGQRVKGYF